MAPRMLENAMERLGAASGLDAVARPLSKKVTALIPQGRMKDLLSGTWMGHPLHPLLTDIPIGAWTSAMILDLLGRRADEDASARLIGLGVVSALPTAVAGLSDWSDTLGDDRRIGLVHAAANVVAVGLYGCSWVARRKGDQRRGVALGMAGATVATVGGFLGGHLSYRNGVNVDRHAWEHPTDDWEDVAALLDLPDGKATSVTVGHDEVLVLRQGEDVVAIHDVCAHMGGPLHEGELSNGCVTCPWHGSVFRLDDGSVVHGPATGPQPSFEARVTGGRVSLRRR